MDHGSTANGLDSIERTRTYSYVRGATTSSVHYLSPHTECLILAQNILDAALRGRGRDNQTFSLLINQAKTKGRRQRRSGDGDTTPGKQTGMGAGIETGAKAVLDASADAAAKTDTVAIRFNVHPVKDAAGCIVGACIVAVDRETIVFRRGTMWDVVADHAAVLKISLTSMPGLRQKRVTSGDGGDGEGGNDGGGGGDRRDVEEGDGYVGGTVLYQSKVASTLLGLEDGSSAAGPTKASLSDIHPEWELQRLRRGKVYEEMVRLRPGESIGNVSHFTACGQCDVVIAKDPVDPAPFVYWMLITPQVKSPTSELNVLFCIVVYITWFKAYMGT